MRVVEGWREMGGREGDWESSGDRRRRMLGGDIEGDVGADVEGDVGGGVSRYGVVCGVGW